MKQTLQLRLGQHLTMTPQLQQAIRLLQLSTLDLQQEIQEALESNLMLETEEDAAGKKQATDDIVAETAHTEKQVDAGSNEKEVDSEQNTMPDELPVDSGWDDIYDSTLPPSSGSSQQKESSNTDYLTQCSSSQTLHDHLIWQMQLTPFSDTDHVIAATIIDSINNDGYLTGNLDDIITAVGGEDVELDEVEAVLHRVQRFDPPGVAARDPRECLLLQLSQLNDSTPWLCEATDLIENHFELLARQDHNQIKRSLKLDDEQLKQINHLIRSLNPHPGTSIADNEPRYVVPDVFVSRRNGSWRVELNPSTTPKLRVNSEYANLIKRADQSDDNTYLKNHLQEARWFIKSLVSRNETLLKVATKIVEFQHGFFDYGEEAMRPLVLRDIAEAVEMHESTISRVTTHKYMHTPRGTLEFKYFFSSHVGTTGGGECSATAIRALIKKLVIAEKPNKPLSDNKIAGILGEQGINIARRTVAKYREAMAIPPSNERKRLA
ncbi:MAG: RNA polymerase factor sigma-54 [Gammaproteobacteria bacterium]|nr:RNA polymerase factor sigma-54 [Gammaproteobacteria bacterium]